MLPMEADEKHYMPTTEAEHAAPIALNSACSHSNHANAQQDRRVRYLALTFIIVLLCFWFLEPSLFALLRHKVLVPGFEPIWNGLTAQLMQFIGLLWFFMLGGSFGSFLHCVEYRMPRGISVVAQGSRCPGCNTAIKAWHNVPVFGWLALRGRCANCGWFIPVRYPAAELVFGCVFVLLMASELITGGYFLPLQLSVHRFGTIELFLNPNWDLVGIYAYHVTLLTFLMTWCLFALDKHKVTISLVVLALVTGVGWQLVQPNVVLQNYKGDWQSVTQTYSLVETAITLLAGCGLGWFLGTLFASRAAESDDYATHSGLLLIGIWLGWQAVLAIVIVSLALRSVLLLLRLAWVPQICSLTAAVFLYLCAWNVWMCIPYWPGSEQQIYWLVCYPPLLMLLVAWLNALETRLNHTC
jgi:leader peptidase (prepilin peptidase) / N-methyltransferase